MVRRYVLISTTLVALLTGCADDGTSLVVECPSIPSDDCVYDPANETCQLNGILNLQVAREYKLVLRVTNGLEPRASDIPLRPEPNGMDVIAAEVSLTSTAGEVLDFGDLPNPYSVTTSGRVGVGESGIARVQAIPPDYVAAMRDAGLESSEGTVVVRVRLLAVTDGDVSVDSREWRWPVDLIAIPAGPMNCVPSDDVRAQCNLGQDSEALPYCGNLL